MLKRFTVCLFLLAGLVTLRLLPTKTLAKATLINGNNSSTAKT